MPLGHVDVALVQRKADGTGDQLLGVVDKRVEGFAQWGKPQAEVNQLSVFETNLLFVVHHFAVQGQRLELAVCGGDQGAARGLIEAAALDANEAILYQVDAADRIAGADLVQQLNDLYRLQRHSVYGYRLAFDEADLHYFLTVRRFLRGAGPNPGGGQGRVTCVLKFAALMADVPQVAVAGVDLLPACRYLDAMGFGVVQAVFTRLQRPLTPGGDDFQVGSERLIRMLKTDLVVAFAGASMGYSVRAFRQRHFYLVLGDHGTRDRRTEEVLMLVNSSGAHGRIDILAHELVSQVEHHGLLGAGSVGFCDHGVQILTLADIGNHGDYIHSVILVKPGNNDRGVETI